MDQVLKIEDTCSRVINALELCVAGERNGESEWLRRGVLTDLVFVAAWLEILGAHLPDNGGHVVRAHAPHQREVECGGCDHEDRDGEKHTAACVVVCAVIYIESDLLAEPVDREELSVARHAGVCPLLPSHSHCCVLNSNLKNQALYKLQKHRNIIQTTYE